jgi:hypothetical protein
MSDLGKAPVFPMQGHMHSIGHRDWEESQYGISMRDWLAAQAMAGMCANHATYGINNGPVSVAERAYQVADAMLAYRASVTETANG